jgi:streptogramin lyase
MSRIRKVLTIAAVSLVAGCGGGGSSNGVPPLSPQPPQPSATPGASLGTASFTIAVPSAPASPTSSARRPMYVSPHTGSVRVAVLVADGQKPAVSDTVAAIAYGAPGCPSDKTQALTCTIPAKTPAGQNVTFKVSTYASSDGSGAVLATATVTKPIGLNQSNAVSVTLGGVVNSVALSPAMLRTTSDGTTQSFLLSVTPLDASGAVIVGTAEFQSPVSLSVSGDTNHALTLTQTTLSAPNIPVELKYDATKAVGDAKVSANVGTLGNATTELIALNYAPQALTLPIGGATQTINVAEFGFTGQFTATIADSTLGTVSVSPGGAPGTATVTVKPPPTGSFDGKTTIALSDGTLTTKIPTSVIYPRLNVTQYGALPFGQNSSSPFSATMTASASPWYVDGSANAVVSFNPFSTQFAQYSTAQFGRPFGITEGPDGNIWFSVQAVPAQICKISELGSIPTCYASGLRNGSYIAGLASGPDGNIYFTDAPFGQPPAIGSIDPKTGTIAEYTPGLTTGARPYSIALGPDNNMWFTDSNTQAVGVFTIATHTSTEFTQGLPQLTPGNFNGASPLIIVAGPDGKMWFTDQNGASPAIGSIDPATHAITEYTYGLQRNSTPTGLTVGPHGLLWFTDPGIFGETLLGSIDPATGTITEYSGVPARNDPQRMVWSSQLPNDLYYTDFSLGGVGDVKVP